MQSFKKVKTFIFNRKLVNTCFKRNTAVNSNPVAEDQADLKSWKEIPGPPSIPIIGPFLPGKLMSDISTLQENLYKLYGPIVKLKTGFGTPKIFVYDPDSIALILRSENWSPVRPGFESLTYYRKYHNKTETGSREMTGLVSEQGPSWRSFRSMVNPVLMKTETINLYQTELEQVANDMIQRIRDNRDENNKLTKELDAEMNLWALESIGTIALGGRLYCFDQNLPEDSPEKQLIKCVREIFTIGIELDFKPNLWRYFSTRNFKKAMEVYGEHERLTTYFIRKAKKENFYKNSDSEKGVLEKLLEIDERGAIGIASDLLIAGVDTTSTTMIATLYYLAKNQDAQDKLREELKTKDSRKYLKACIRESIRLMPVIPVNTRITQKEYNILGYRIPKDFYIVIPHQYVSTMESEFPRSLEYIPERWIQDEPLYYKNHAHPFAYTPFGYGVRVCIGSRIANLEIETFLEKVIQNFKLEWNGPSPKIESVILNYLKGPFYMTFQDV